MEVLGNGRKTHGIAAQLLDASPKSWIRRSLFLAGDRAADTGLTLHPTRPAERHVHLRTVTLHIHGALLQQHAHDLLSIVRGGLGCRPQAREVLRSTPDAVAFAQGELGGLCTAAPRIRFLLVLFMTPGLFPLPLPLTPHQPVCGLDGVRLTRGAFGTVVGSLSALLPMGLQLAARGSYSVCSGDAQCHRGGLQHGHELGDHPGIQQGARQAETTGGPIINRRPPARVTAMIGLATGAGHQATTTSPTR